MLPDMKRLVGRMISRKGLATFLRDLADFILSVMGTLL